MKKIIALVVVVVVAGAFLGFTTPGHRVLNTLGFATAYDPKRRRRRRQRRKLMVVVATIAERHEERTMKKIIALVVVVGVAGAFLGFTTPGHRVLNTLGFATADGSGCTGSNC